MRAAAIGLIAMSALIFAGEARAQQANPTTATAPDLTVLMDIFRSQVVPHWNLTFCEMDGADRLMVRVRVGIAADGSLVGQPSVLEPRADHVWRAASESSIRALQAAQPFDVPPDFPGAVIVFAFDARSACNP